MSPVIEARRPISKSALGDRLRKSNSSEPLATHDEEPSSSSDEEGNSENSRTGKSFLTSVFLYLHCFW